MAVIKSNAPAGGIKQKLSSWAKDKALQGHKNMMDGLVLYYLSLFCII